MSNMCSCLGTIIPDPGFGTPSRHARTGVGSGSGEGWWLRGSSSEDPPKARANVLGVTSSPFWESREQVEVRAGPEKNCGPGGTFAPQENPGIPLPESQATGKEKLVCWPGLGAPSLCPAWGLGKEA